VDGKDNDPPPRESDRNAESKSSPGTMFVSILLLIASLLLTSVLLLDSGFDRKGRPEKSAFGFPLPLEKAKGLFSAEKAESTATASPTLQGKTSKKKGLLGFSFKEKKKDNVHWPRLKLTGFGKAAAGETGFAIINGKRVDVGDVANGAIVVGILDQGVELEYQGATKILTMEVPH